jgi:hypothetical protein
VWAKELDVEVMRRINEQAIEQRVDMVRRHSQNSKEMQDKALEFLRENELKGANAAIRLWVEATQIEKASLGLDALIDTVSKLTDQDLLAKIKKLAVDNEVTPEDFNV